MIAAVAWSTIIGVLLVILIVVAIVAVLSRRRW